MIKNISILTVIVLVLGLLFFFELAPKLLSSHVAASLHKECPKCVLHYKALKVSWVPFRLVADGLDFKDDAAANPVVTISAEEIELKFRFAQLLFGLVKDVPTIDRLTLSGLYVTVQERVTHAVTTGPKYPQTGAVINSIFPMRVNKILIQRSHFKYEHFIRGKIAAIHVEDIDSEIGAFATRDWLLTEGYQHPVKIIASARLENSGHAELNISFDPFAKKNRDEIVIKLKEQDLSTLNRFFEAEDGIQLSGLLKQGTASLLLSEGRLSGTLTSAYQDVQIKFNSTADRGPIKGFVSNMIQSAAITRTRPRQREKTIPKVLVSALRKPHEPVTKLIIRGLRDAAKAILTG